MNARLEAAPWTREQLELAANVYLDLIDREHCPGAVKRWESQRVVEQYLRQIAGKPIDMRQDTPGCRELEAWLASHGSRGVDLRDVYAWFEARDYNAPRASAGYRLRALELARKVDWRRGRGRQGGWVRWTGGAG